MAQLTVRIASFRRQGRGKLTLRSRGRRRQTAPGTQRRLQRRFGGSFCHYVSGQPISYISSVATQRSPFHLTSLRSPFALRSPAPGGRRSVPIRRRLRRFAGLLVIKTRFFKLSCKALGALVRPWSLVRPGFSPFSPLSGTN